MCPQHTVLPNYRQRLSFLTAQNPASDLHLISRRFLSDIDLIFISEIRGLSRLPMKPKIFQHSALETPPPPLPPTTKEALVAVYLDKLSVFVMLFQRQMNKHAVLPRPPSGFISVCTITKPQKLA